MGLMFLKSLGDFEKSFPFKLLNMLAIVGVWGFF